MKSQLKIAVAIFSIVASVGCRTAPAAPAPHGMDSLSDDKVRIELANDGLKTLLERAFVVDQVPEDKRAPERTVLALKELNSAKLSPQEKQLRIQTVAAGITAALPNMNNVEELLSDANLLLEAEKGDLNIIEYFGEDGSDAQKARVRPAVETAVALYDKAVTLLDQKQQKMGNVLNMNSKQADIDAYQAANGKYLFTLYNRWLLGFPNAMVLDPANPARATIAQQAIDALAQWQDDPGVGIEVRTVTAKLYILKGKPADLKNARTAIAGITRVQPDPTWNAADKSKFDERMKAAGFDAKYLEAVCDLTAGDAATAVTDAKAADDYRLKTFPDYKGDEYAMDMLNYRIAKAQGDAAGAVKILQTLAGKAPSLRKIIAERLVAALPPNPDMKALDALTLLALRDEAWIESGRPAPDSKVLDRGLDAIKEYLAKAKKGDPETNAEGVSTAMLARGLILKAENKHAEAATAFIDYAELYKDDPKSQAQGAVEEAKGQLYLLEKENGQPHQADIDPLMDRLMSVAVTKFHQTDLAYEYGRRLQRNGKIAAAIAAFNLVPADDPNAFSAKYLKMIALNQRLEADPKKDSDDALLPAEKPAIIQQIQQLADQIVAESIKLEDASKDDAKKLNYRLFRVSATLLAADLARIDSDDPKRALDLLNNFEATLKGFPPAQAKVLLTQALGARVQCYMATGDTGKATDALLAYLNSASGNEGLETVYKLLTKLNKELDVAQAANNQKLVSDLARHRAELTPFLVTWAEKSSNPDIHKYVYRYRVFDAGTQELAATLETDPAKRTEKLKAVLERYKDLQSPENTKLYQASLPPGTTPDVLNYPDTQVMLGIANTAFELGDWKTVHDTIGQLLADSKLGGGEVITKGPTGDEQLVENEQYWEAQYKFIKATAEMAKDSTTGVEPQTPKIMLGRLYVQWQDHTGGKKFHAQFDALAKELNVETAAPTAPASAPPVAAK